jgi:hypothetical protein
MGRDHAVRCQHANDALCGINTNPGNRLRDVTANYREAVEGIYMVMSVLERLIKTRAGTRHKYLTRSYNCFLGLAVCVYALRTARLHGGRIYVEYRITGNRFGSKLP